MITVGVGKTFKIIPRLAPKIHSTWVIDDDTWAEAENEMIHASSSGMSFCQVTICFSLLGSWNPCTQYLLYFLLGSPSSLIE